MNVLCLSVSEFSLEVHLKLVIRECFSCFKKSITVLLAKVFLKYIRLIHRELILLVLTP